MVLIKDSNVTIVGKYWDSTIIPILIYPSTWTTGSINGLLNNGWGRAQTRQLKHRGSFIFGAPNTQSSQRVYVFNQRSHRQELAWLQADEQRRQASAKTDQCPILIFEQACQYVCQSMCKSGQTAANVVWQPVVKKVLPNILYAETGAGPTNLKVLVSGSVKGPKGDAAVKATRRKCAAISSWEIAARKFHGELLVIARWYISKFILCNKFK